MVFGDVLRVRRLRLGLSQRVLAERAGVALRTVRDVEGGRIRRPRPSTVTLLADALGLSGPERDQFCAAALGGEAHLGHQAADWPAANHALPRGVACFTGREAELSAITDRVRPGWDGPVVALVGMPGVGKTALAVHAAHRLAAHFPDRQLFVDLGGHAPGRAPADPADVLAEQLVADGVEPRFLPEGLPERAALWRHRVAGRRMLLVLDDAAGSAQVLPLLPGPSCLVLVTSRRHLADLPAAVALPVDPPPEPDARRMFLGLSGRADAEAADVHRLVDVCGRLPLAISLLARLLVRHPSWSLPDLLAEVASGLLEVAPEERSVAAAFALSYRHLPDELRRTFRYLGLAPGLVLDPAAVAASTGLDPAVAAEHLDQLHARHLVLERGVRRYRMHDLIARYAASLAEQEEPAEQRAAAAERLLDHYQQAADLAGRRLARPWEAAADGAGGQPADPAEARAWLALEHANLMACLDQVVASGDPARIIAFGSALAVHLRTHGPWGRALQVHATVARLAGEQADVRARLLALQDLGRTQRLTGDYPNGRRTLQRTIGLARAAGDARAEARVLIELGVIGYLLDEYREAEQDFVAARELSGRSGDRHGLAEALNYLGLLHNLNGRYQESGEELAAALALYQELGDVLGQSNTLVNLGVRTQLTGAPADGAELLQRALQLCRQCGNRLGESNALKYLGVVHRLLGDAACSAEVLDRAVEAAHTLGDLLGEASARCERSATRVQLLDLSGAERDLGRAGEIFRSLGDRYGEAEVANLTGALYRTRRQRGPALVEHRHALGLARQIGARFVEALALDGIGRCLAPTDPSAARDALEQARSLYRELGSAEGEALARDLPDLLGGGGSGPGSTVGAGFNGQGRVHR